MHKRLRCLLGAHVWMPAVVATIPGAEIHPPGSGVALPSWCDITVKISYCPYCRKVRAVASWRDGSRTRGALISLAWAMWHLGAGSEK